MTDTHDNIDSRPDLDAATLRAVREREPAALERFFAAFHDRVFAYLLRLVNDRSLAEDLAQEVFLRLHRALDHLDPDRDPAPWVFTVAANLLRDYWRSAEHRRRGEHHDIADLDERLSAPGEDALESMSRAESEACLRRQLARLSENDRQLVLLRSYAGLDAGALAESLNIKREAVRQRFSRALKRLGEFYRKYCEPERRSI
jgi:RNA polymerase sigma-70 factor, ECF subfamily